MDVITPTMVVSAAGTLIGRYFQNRNEENTRLRKERDDELARSVEFASEISKRMDKYLYSSKEVYNAYDYGLDKKNEAEFKKRWEAFTEVNSEWESRVNLEIALAANFFGDNMKKGFIDGICKNFIKLRDDLNSMYYPNDKNKKKSIAELPNDEETGEPIFLKIWEELGGFIQVFNAEMLRLITIENVGVLRKYR